MTRKTSLVAYQAGSATLTGYLAEPTGNGPFPGVLVAHEAIGMNDHIRSRADRLAVLGYSAFALDLYGETDLALDAARAKSIEIMRTPGLLRTRAVAGLNAFLAHGRTDPSRLAAIGFCQGGSTVLELARADTRLKAVVGFHPGFRRPSGAGEGTVRAKVLMMSGDADPVVTAEDRNEFEKEMRDAGVDWQLLLFGGVGHSFTNSGIDAFGFPGFEYCAVANRRSWALMLALLQEVFDEN